MRTLTVIPERGRQRKRLKHTPLDTTAASKANNTTKQAPPPANLQRHPRPRNPKRLGGHIAKRIRHAFTPLIDAKAASQLLGVPYTWLLAQARANKIPHQRLGHYVRFDPDDLQNWLRETRSEPSAGRRER
jgi:excisionase family DNA binding protein